jgi:hypothetical protein
MGEELHGIIAARHGVAHERLFRIFLSWPRATRVAHERPFRIKKVNLWISLHSGFYSYKKG